MTGLLRVLAGLLPIRIHGPLVTVYVEHVGAVHNTPTAALPACACPDQDAPEEVTVGFTEGTLYAWARDLIKRGQESIAEDPDDAAREFIADLRLTEAVSDAWDET